MAAALVLLHSDDQSNAPAPALGTLRVAHGIAGVIVLLFAVFHVVNHVFSLAGPEAYNALMTAGGKVYRSSFAEPILVLAMLFQIFSGLYLMWRWSKVHTDIYRVFQIGSGVYLAAFILGHMNSVFVYARMHLGIPTDWAFASGGSAGLLFDSWNIRLLPHYALAILLLVVHVTSGLRVVLIAHGTQLSTANRIWKLGIAIGAASAAAVAAGLVGARL
ncbi:hypothetical protein [Stenotrophomonas sp. YAU14A_MKIMI4_1]|uniref:hypothetical protein n=1 Tax=Stenotrophomonas sp. YAU14A_MKIMI4_1 TaxID=2072408 RepID=UPI001900EA17|nr:hypothetical protein [Stenotrophomonas sp. YAU14A_MKIMI4_1]